MSEPYLWPVTLHVLAARRRAAGLARFNAGVAVLLVYIAVRLTRRG